MTTRGFGINPELVRQPLGILPQRARIEAADSSLQSTTRARLMAGEDVGVDDEVQELTAEQRAAFEEEEEQLRMLGAHDRSYEGRE